MFVFSFKTFCILNLSHFLQLKHGLRESNLQLIPSELRPTIKLLLNATVELRPTAAQLAQIPYFEVSYIIKNNDNDTLDMIGKPNCNYNL